MTTPRVSRRSQIAAVSSVAGSSDSVADEFEPQIEAGAVDGADDRVLVDQRKKAALEVCADDARVLLQAFLFDHVEDGHADRGRDR